MGKKYIFLFISILFALAPLISIANAPLDLTVGETFIFAIRSREFLVVYSLNAIIEIIFALLLLLLIKLPKKILWSVFLANVISYPIFLFLQAFFEVNYPVGSSFSLFILLELFVILIESLIIFLINRTLLSFQRAFLMALIINIVSFFLGIWFLLDRVFYYLESINFFK